MSLFHNTCPNIPLSYIILTLSQPITYLYIHQQCQAPDKPINKQQASTFKAFGTTWPGDRLELMQTADALTTSPSSFIIHAHSAEPVGLAGSRGWREFARPLWPAKRSALGWRLAEFTSQWTRLSPPVNRAQTGSSYISWPENSMTWEQCPLIAGREHFMEKLLLCKCDIILGGFLWVILQSRFTCT